MLPRVTIKAWLDGDSPDLEYLAAMLPRGDVHVAQDGDRFYLAAAELDTPMAGEQFYDVARKLRFAHRFSVRILRLNWVELSGLEPLTSCMPSVGSTSACVHPRRSPSSRVPASPPASG
jgi:hypothetical protein